MFQKWAYKSAGKGWYMIDLNNECPFVWAFIIDEFWTFLEQKCPEFKIKQTKIKYGSLRMYLDFPPHERGNFNEEIMELENWLSDERLVY